MDNVDNKTFWAEAIRLLMDSGNLTEQEYDMWFRHMNLLASTEDSLIFSVPSNFHRDQIKFRYLSLIEETLYNLSKTTLTINFEVHKADSLDPVQKNHQKAVKKTPNSVKISHSKPHPQLKQEYTFNSYIIGNNNSFAVGAAQAISQNPGEKYNPFLIYGGVGLGKTHLMQAIGNSIYNSSGKKKIIYVAAESFVNEFISSIRHNTQSKFKANYRNIDILLIDDIHDLQNKKETQEELFHTFNSLYDAKKLLVFTCDRPPSELKNFTARLRNRFELGLYVDLQPPNYETRYAILNKKIETIKIDIPSEVVELIARNVTTNIRDLESSLTKIVAYTELVGKKITIEIVQQQLKGVFSGSLNSNITINKVQRTVSEYFNITTSDLKGKKRTKQITYPRQIAMYIIREVTDYSTTEIGLEFGGRDHTTVIHSCQKIEDRMKSDSSLEPILIDLIRTIKDSG